MRCRQARGAIAAGLERELALEQRLQLDAHLATCAACAQRAARQQRLQELLEGPGDPAPVRADVEAAVRVVFARLARGEGEPLRSARPRRDLLRPVLLGALAVAALVLFFFLRADGPVQDAPPVSVTPVTSEPPWAESEVEVAVRAALLAGFAQDAPPAAAAAAFQERLRAPARAGWPVRRFVEGFVERPDAVLAGAALRCLGALGDANALPSVERALARPELRAPAFAALVALGTPSFAVLERAFGDDELAPAALAALCQLGGERATAIVERAAGAARPEASLSRAALLDALTATGPEAVASLLRLAGAARTRAESQELLARLPLVRGAGPALVRELERVRAPDERHYAALLLLQPYEALPWLAARCASHRERAAALEVLAAYPGTPPLATLLALEDGGRVPREELVALLVGLLERDALRAPAFSRELVALAELPAARAWLALLLESEHPAAAAALVPLVLAPELSDEDRQWAALGVAELGGADEARELALALPCSARVERRVLAAAVLAIHAGLGDEGVTAWLGPCSASERKRVLLSLENGERGGAAVRLHRVARALEGVRAEQDQALLARQEP